VRWLEPFVWHESEYVSANCLRSYHTNHVAAINSKLPDILTHTRTREKEVERKYGGQR